MAQHWTLDAMPDQQGRLVVITGANSGIGFEAAKALAGKGARVILAVRNAAKGQVALEKIRAVHPQAQVELDLLDLADLSSVRAFAERFQTRYSALPVLINNAGVMATPYRRTADGFELQFGTNHLGHFALTGLLLPAILAAPGARVVTVSSMAHSFGQINFDNLDGSKGYQRWMAYGQSKLANLLFAYELQRRFAASGARAISLACHPGYADTELQKVGPRMDGFALGEALSGLLNRVFAQSAAMGALPTLYAATSPDAHGGDFIGPDGPGGARGYPVPQRSNARSYDPALARRLWEVSEQLTGVRYAFPAEVYAAD
ncbi:MAG: oxidoreductase [Oscillochloridaceae bacterium]|nr:oxidoreductase [Chloroflexaceae bacterium]MDW8389795.1 oxidoreductase [Oscillochloridaceae bacterium]